MKISKKSIIAFAGILLLAIAALAFPTIKKPFKDLTAAEIELATVRLEPFDKTIQITDTKELADYLREVVIYNKDDSYTKYKGEAIFFNLTMSDGSQTKIEDRNPFLIIDGVSYRTAYEPCEALRIYANRLLDAEDAIIMEAPPRLDVIIGETCNSALLGTYSWGSPGGYVTEADSAHPLDCQEWLLPVETKETTATLRFTKEPDDILFVCCWSDEHWGEYDADWENVSVQGNEIELKPGAYIYSVAARWDTEKSGYGGVAYYFFYAKVLE